MVRQFMQKKCIQQILLYIIKIFCLSLHYNGDNSYLFVNGKEIINFKAKDSATVPYPLCLGNISKVFDLGYMEKTGITVYIYDFSVDY